MSETDLTTAHGDRPILPSDEGVQLWFNYDFTRTHACFDRLDVGEWQKACGQLLHSMECQPWLLGDLFNTGKRFLENAGSGLDGDEQVLGIARLFPHAHLEEHRFKAVLNWAAVARAYPPRDRFATLKWEHHRELMVLPDARERRRWLLQAAEGNWSVKRLREEALATKRLKDVKQAPPPWFSMSRVALEIVRWGNEICPKDEAPKWELIRSVQGELKPARETLRKFGVELVFHEPES